MLKVWGTGKVCVCVVEVVGGGKTVKRRGGGGDKDQDGEKEAADPASSLGTQWPARVHKQN